MGATLFLIACPWPEDETGKDAPASTSLATELKRRWDSLSEEDRALAVQEARGVEDTADLTVEIHELIDDVFGPAFRRDVSILTLGGRTWMFTGGLSTGDPPTEAWEPLSVVMASGITVSPVIDPFEEVMD